MKTGPNWVSLAAVFLVVFAFAWTVLSLSGGLAADLTADPDEGAHAVTSLMVRDYLVGGGFDHPLRFAEAYYNAFPKVALGHYPPGFYAVSAIPLVFFCDPSSLLYLQCVWLALSSTLVFWLGIRGFKSWKVGGIAALILAILPPMLRLVPMVMADLLLGFLCLCAAACWLRYLESGRISWSLGFGFFAMAAILTKGSALMLAGLPVGSMALLGRWNWLRRPSFWAAALPVAVGALPWMLYSSGITREGMVQTPVPDFLVQSLTFYLSRLPENLGWVVILGVFLGLRVPVGRRSRMADVEALCLAWMLSGIAFLLLIPAGLTTRYLVPILPPLVLLAASGFVTGLSSVRSLPLKRAAFALVLSLAVVPVFKLPVKSGSGFRLSVQDTLRLPGNEKEVWFVSSDARGESALISAACFGLSTKQRLSGDLQILRASKVLSESDWLGRDYRLDVKDDKEVLDRLTELSVDRVWLDRSVPDRKRVSHHELMEEAVAIPKSGWRQVMETPVRRDGEADGLLQQFQSSEEEA